MCIILHQLPSSRHTERKHFSTWPPASIGIWWQPKVSFHLVWNVLESWRWFVTLLTLKIVNELSNPVHTPSAESNLEWWTHQLPICWWFSSSDFPNQPLMIIRSPSFNYRKSLMSLDWFWGRRKIARRAHVKKPASLRYFSFRNAGPNHPKILEKTLVNYSQYILGKNVPNHQPDENPIQRSRNSHHLYALP